MLVLTRKEGEAIVLSDGVVVRVLSIKPGSVSLGIEAPKHVSVYREEILARIMEQPSHED